MPREAFVLREQTPLEITLYAIYLYLSGLSLRQTARTLRALGVSRSHEAVGRWVHRLADKAQQLIPEERARVAIVDETAVNVGGKQVWLWLAIEPERRAVLAIMLTRTRNAFIAYSLFRDLRRRGVRHVVTDGARWYALAAEWARLRHSVVRGGVRSYVERFAGAVKDRLRGFDCYFPSPRRLPGSALRLVYAWAGFYNYVRVHLSFGEPPRPLPGACELERLKALALKEVLS